MTSTDLPLIGGAPVVRLRAEGGGEAPGFISADVAPGRGMLLLQARARFPGLGEIDLLATPPLGEAARLLDGGQGDAFGNAAFGLGAAVLLPYANRIRGRVLDGLPEIETLVLGRTVRLPRNWGGKAAGAEQYAMHGLVLDRAMDRLERATAEGRDALLGTLQAGGFGGRWPGSLDLAFELALEPTALSLTIEARNVGSAPTAVGIGWHPWFALPSGDRSQARLRLPATARAVVNDYDEVLPTGDVVAVAGTPYDFSASAGRTLGSLYLDDCFTGLVARDGRATAEIADPASGVGIRIGAASPSVTAFQVYAPPDRAVVVVEPQFNLADPFGAQWRGRDTGMVVLQPGAATAYSARLELFEVRAA